MPELTAEQETTRLPTTEWINLSINITMRCNTVCKHCNRGIGTLDWRDVPDMTPDDARRLVKGILKAGYPVKKIKLMGGEPTIHPQLLELVEIFNPVCRMLWVVSNALISVRKLPDLPQGAKYKREPVNEKDHHAFFVSPADIGYEDRIKHPLRNCKAILLCGRGVEPEGFTQCSLAKTLVRALGWDDSDLYYDEPVTHDPDEAICRHCPLSLGTKENKNLTLRVARGHFPCPTESFVNIKKDYKILEQADSHLRRLEDRNVINYDHSTGLVTDYDEAGRQLHQIEAMPS